MQLDRDVELANGLQRLVELDLAAIDVEALVLQLVRDVGRGDRTEELIVLARLAGEASARHAGELLAEASASPFSRARRRTAAAFICSMTARLAAVASIASFLGMQIVAAIAFGHLHHVTARAQLVYVFLQNDFHGKLRRDSG